MLRTATDLLGTPYRNGGSTVEGFDCSGFVQYVFAQHGVRIPRTVRMQAEVGAKVREAEAGDQSGIVRVSDHTDGFSPIVAMTGVRVS